MPTNDMQAQVISLVSLLSVGGNMSQSEEIELVDLLAQGMTAQEAADAIGKPVRTVNFRLQVLYAKHNVPPGKHRNIKLLIATGHICRQKETAL